MNLISSLVRPGSTYIDVGANIGLLAIPLLVRQPSIKVISIEPSPSTLRFLERTQAVSPHRDRWSVLGYAAGKERGSAEFYTAAPQNGAFNGFKDTGRGGAKHPVTVEVRPLDEIWRNVNMPLVSVVKIDVEGAESEVILGAGQLIKKSKPVFVVEWSERNLSTYGVKPTHLFDICHDIGYQIHIVPSLAKVQNEFVLRAAMAQTETFLLVPAHAS